MNLFQNMCNIELAVHQSYKDDLWSDNCIPYASNEPTKALVTLNSVESPTFGRLLIN